MKIPIFGLILIELSWLSEKNEKLKSKNIETKKVETYSNIIPSSLSLRNYTCEKNNNIIEYSSSKAYVNLCYENRYLR